MGEHQIVIKLKPEQLHELRRLAQAAGAESVSTFLKQRLLVELGSDAPQTDIEIDDSANWQSITGQIRRLHRELQTFIAESTNAGAEVSLEEETRGGRSSEPLFNDAVPVLLESEPDDRPRQPEPPPARQSTFDPSADRLEQLADKAFAISPRLGALESDAQDPLGDLLEDALLNRADEEDDEIEPSPTDEEALPEPDVADPSLSSATDNAVTEKRDTANDDVGTGSQTTGESTYESDPSSPPISGGPPPRKRRT